MPSEFVCRYSAQHSIAFLPFNRTTFMKYLHYVTERVHCQSEENEAEFVNFISSTAACCRNQRMQTARSYVPLF